MVAAAEAAWMEEDENTYEVEMENDSNDDADETMQYDTYDAEDVDAASSSDDDHDPYPSAWMVWIDSCRLSSASIDRSMH